MTPAYLASLCAAIYSPVPGWFDSIFDNGSVCVGIQLRDGKTILAFRGSKTGLDWLHDFEAVPVHVAGLGTVHGGFYDGTVDAFRSLDLHEGASVIITGHSLGCSHAAIIAHMCLNAGVKVEQLYLFAPPRCGYSDFLNGLDFIPDVKAWCNGLDPVPHVPIWLPDFPWMQFPLIHIFERPEGLDEFIPTDWHSIELYLKSVQS